MKLNIEVFEIFGPEAKRSYWKVFEKHHYLSNELNVAARCWIATLNGELVGFNSVLPQPSGTLSNAFREHRLVILADFQGMGLGTSLSECIGTIMRSEGKRYYSKTTNPKLGLYRNNSRKWRPTTKNGIARKVNEGRNRNMSNSSVRYGVICFSHEYMGEDYNE